MRFFFWLLITDLFIKTSTAQARIPELIEEHINRELPHIQMLNNLNYSAEQESNLIHRYIDTLAKQYKVILSLKDKEEIAEKMAQLAHMAPNPSFPIFEKLDDVIPLTKLNDFVQKFFQKETTKKPEKINIIYKDVSIPLFLEKEGEKLYISMNGIAVDNQRASTNRLSAPVAVLGARACLLLKNEITSPKAELLVLNVNNVACPIPKGASGSYLLGLAENLAKSLGKKKIKGKDESFIICEKDGETTSLALWTIFRLGKTWYGLHGYRSIDNDRSINYDDETTQDYRNFPLPKLKAELDIIEQNLDTLKKGMLEKADANSAPYINEEFSQFDNLKRAFDKEATEYMANKKESDLILGKFFSWLWDKDCQRYMQLEDFLFSSRATKKIKLRKLDPLPYELSKDL